MMRLKQGPPRFMGHETGPTEFDGASALLLSMIKYETAEFKRDCTSIFYANLSSGPNEVNTSEMIERFHDIVINILREEVRQITETVHT